MGRMLSIYLWVIIDIFVFNLLVLPLFINIKRHKKNTICLNNQTSPISAILWFSLILFFCLFDQTSGDYFHYRDDIRDMQRFHDDHYGMEWIYNQVIVLFGYSYLLFRLFVWGFAMFFYRKILIELRIHNLISYSLMALVLLRYFSYGRYALAFSMFLYGFVLLFNEKQTKKIYGIILIVFSILFHKTIVVLFPLLLLTIVPLNVYTVCACIVAAPFIVSLINNNISDYMLLLDPEINRAELRYLNSEREYDNTIREFILFYSYLIPILFFLYKFYKFYKSHIVPQVYKYMFKLILLIFYVVLILYFIDVGSASIYNRIRIIAFYPICIIVSFYINQLGKQGLNISCLWMFFLLLFSDNIYYAYLFYLKTIGLGV